METHNEWWDPPVHTRDANGNMMYQIGDGTMFKHIGQAIEASKYLKIASGTAPPGAMMAPIPPMHLQASGTAPPSTMVASGIAPPGPVMVPIRPVQPQVPPMGTSSLMQTFSPSPMQPQLAMRQHQVPLIQPPMPAMQPFMDVNSLGWLLPDGTIRSIQHNLMQPSPLLSQHMAPPPPELQKKYRSLITWNFGGNNVFVHGSWDNWAQTYTLTPCVGGHSLSLLLYPGTYGYRYIVDGVQCTNGLLPLQKDTSGNPFNLLVVPMQPSPLLSQHMVAPKNGGEQKVLGTPSENFHAEASSSAPPLPPPELQKKYRPSLIRWNLGGQNVSVHGSWDNWDQMYTLRPCVGGHSLSLLLHPGTYGYRYIVDGVQCTDVSLPSQKDSIGNPFNLLIVPDLVPEPVIDGAVSLPDFLKDPKNAPVEPYELKVGIDTEFGSIPANTTMYPITPTGTILLNSYVAHAVKNFRNGLCWGGEFTKEDMIVIDGVLCKINKRPAYKLSLPYLTLDLDKIIIHLLSEFKKCPYIDYLEMVLKSPPSDFDTNPTSRESYFEKLTCNATLSTHGARMMALINLDQYLDGNGLPETLQRRTIDHLFDSLLSKLDPPPSWKPSPTNPNYKPSWIDIAHLDKLFDAVYWGDKLDKTKERYAATCLNMIKHLRHFFVHAPQKTMRNKKQMLESFKELDLIIWYYHKDFLAHFLDHIRELCRKDNCHSLLIALWELFSETAKLFEQK